MTHKIIILASAEHDLKELRHYIIKHFSNKTWLTTYKKIKEATQNLKQHPYSGSIPEELELLNLTQYRQTITGMNRIIYEIRQNIIYIHIIADTRKNFKTLLEKRFLRIN